MRISRLVLSKPTSGGISASMEWEGESYLCHGYCELGAQPLAEGLAEVERFLHDHPRELALIIFQDGLSDEVMVAALEESGLASRAWAHTGELPTMGQLIDAGTNVVITAEHGGPPPDWYHHAWDLIQDTPYDYQAAEEMSCDLFRGSEDSPLFLVNHWLGTPLPTETGAMEVNAQAILGARADACEAEREQRVNILAVDFYNRGDLFSVVDTLNGID